MFNRVFKSNKKPKVIQDSINIIKDAAKDRKYDLKDRTAYARECIDFYDNISKVLGEQKNGFNPINKNLAEALSSDFTNVLRSRQGFATSKDISNLIFIYNQTLSRLERPENSKYSSDFSKELLKTAIDDLKDILQFFQ